ncbi:MAG: hypothetical protein SGARI_002499 [Bacillariaceae sp.]
MNDLFDLIYHPGSTCTSKEDWDYHLERVVRRDRDLRALIDFFLRPWTATQHANIGHQDYRFERKMSDAVRPVLNEAIGSESDMNVLLSFLATFTDKEYAELTQEYIEYLLPIYQTIFDRNDNIDDGRDTRMIVESLVRDKGQHVHDAFHHAKSMLKARISDLVFIRLRNGFCGGSSKTASPNTLESGSQGSVVADLGMALEAFCIGMAFVGRDNLSAIMDAYLRPWSVTKTTVTTRRVESEARISPVLKVIFDEAVGNEVDMNALLSNYAKMTAFYNDIVLLLGDHCIHAAFIHAEHMLKARISHLVYVRLRKHLSDSDSNADSIPAVQKLSEKLS